MSSRRCDVLRDSGFDGVVIDDHVPLLDGDPEIIPGFVKSEYAYHGRAYELGYLQGLLAGVLADESLAPFEQRRPPLEADAAPSSDERRGDQLRLDAHPGA